MSDTNTKEMQTPAQGDTADPELAAQEAAELAQLDAEATGGTTGQLGVDEIPVVEGANKGLVHREIPATTLIDELPDAAVVAAELREVVSYRLPANPPRDDSHALTPPQMAMIINYAKQEYDRGEQFGDVVAKLRAKFLRGNQKDWNICGKISEESRLATAHEPITEEQMRMVFDAILPALREHNRTPHWDPSIEANIRAMTRAQRESLIVQGLKVDDRQGVSVFMRKFQSLAGRPLSQQGRAAQQAAAAGAAQTAGVPAGGFSNQPEPF